MAAVRNIGQWTQVWPSWRKKKFQSKLHNEFFTFLCPGQSLCQQPR